MSDSVRPHSRQPTRLPCPRDSPGKNPGVGCHFLVRCMTVKSESEVAQSCPILSDPMDCSPPGSSVPGTSQARVLEWVAISFSRGYKPLGSLNSFLSHAPQLRGAGRGVNSVSLFTLHFPQLLSNQRRGWGSNIQRIAVWDSYLEVRNC